MDKKYFLFRSLIMAVMVFASIVSLSSCDKNDKEGPGSSSPSESESTSVNNTTEENWENESKLAFEKRDDGYWVVGIGECVGGDLVIPSTYKGEAVVGIADAAFLSEEYNNAILDDSDITSVTIGEGVKYIGNHAFGCIKLYGGHVWLVSVNLPSSLISIGEEAFRGCVSIEKIEIPKSVTSIGAGAFRSCTKLASVTLPDSLSFLGERAFIDCRSLKTITLPEKITEIAPSTFNGCTSLESVKVNGQITTIGEAAFKSCEKLSAFDFAEGLQRIEGEAFEYCKKLTELHLPDTLVEIASGAFSGCSSVKSLTLGAGISVIPEGAFCGLSGLEELTIPDHVVEIGRNAFDGLTSLKTLTLPKSVKKMEYCFNSTRSIESVYYEGSLADWVAIDMSNVASSPFYYAPSAKLYLSHVAFEGDIVLPAGITRINDNAFENYRYITSITFPHDMEYIGNEAFRCCEGLTGVTFAGDVAEFGLQIFYGCTDLANVDLGERLTKTGPAMFLWCGSLEKLVIPSNVKFIQWDSFSYCGLKELILSEGVEHLGTGAFDAMNIDVHLPKSIKVLERSAFATSGRITYAGTVEEWAEVLAEHLWNEYYSEFIVSCTNGDVTVPHPYS